MKYHYAVIAESLTDDPCNGHEAGTKSLHFGRNPDPDYTVLVDDGTKRITHEIIQRIESPKALSKDEFKDYVENEFLPIDDTEGDIRE